MRAQLTTSRFPAGTVVGAYAGTEWPGAGTPGDRAPRSAALDTSTVAAAGALVFTGLDAAEKFWAVAEVEGAWRWVRFSTPASQTAAFEVEDPEDLALLVDVPADQSEDAVLVRKDGEEIFAVDAEGVMRVTGVQELSGPLVMRADIDPLDPVFSELGGYHRALSAGERAIEMADAAQIVERWSDVAAWTSVGAPHAVSGGRLYSDPGGAGNQGAVRAFTPSGRAHVSGQIHYVADDPGFGALVIGVTQTSPLAAPANQADVTGIRILTDGTVNALGSGDSIGEGVGDVPSPLPTGVYQVGIWFADGQIVGSLTPDDHAWELRFRFATADPITGLHIANGDSRGSAGGGSSIGPIAAIEGHVTVPGALEDIEDAGPKVMHYYPAAFSDPSWIALPVGYDARRPTPLVLFAHHAGGEGLTPYVDPLTKPIIDACLEAGWMVAAGDFGNGDGGLYNWGSPDAVDRFAALWEFSRDHFTLGPVLMLAVSMGGMVSLNAITQRRVPGVVGWAGVQPVTNLADIYDRNATYREQIEDAYGMAEDGSDYDDLAEGSDPALASPLAFRGLPMRFYASAADIVVPKAEHTDVLRAAVLPLAREASLYTATGAHGDASHFQPADVVSFFERCLAGA